MKDKKDDVYVIVGGTSGIGFSMVLKIIHEEPMAKIIATGSSVDTCRLAEEKFLKELGEERGRVQILPCNLNERENIFQLSKLILLRCKSIKALYLNAGAIYFPGKNNTKNIFKINASNQFLLAMELRNIVEKIILTSSSLLLAPIYCNENNISNVFNLREYDNSGLLAAKYYSTSKLAQLVFAEYFWKEHKTPVGVFIPGRVATNLKKRDRLKYSPIPSDSGFQRFTASEAADGLFLFSKNIHPGVTLGSKYNLGFFVLDILPSLGRIAATSGFDLSFVFSALIWINEVFQKVSLFHPVQPFYKINKRFLTGLKLEEMERLVSKWIE
eukprot:snap_masked-scaffold_9-processed-gene-12.20-mRNA-1 protein AED:1.00 eAED:1.00 QI:0/0/0/0/1/1/2/0/327